jgi:hypothetical protein
MSDMPDWLTELANRWGLATPLLYAAAVYGFFFWLEKNTSKPAKQAFAVYLEPRVYDREAIAAAILELFDEVYTHPLFTRRAFFRSLLITISITLIVIFEYNRAVIDVLYHNKYLVLIILFTFSVNIISDYISLFIVRACLADRRLTPFMALIVGPILGVLFVTSCVLLRASTIPLINDLVGNDWLPSSYPRNDWLHAFMMLIVSKVIIITSAGALLVHMWLPLFALSIGLLRGMYYFLLATRWAQWFLRRAQGHPFEVVGLVAAPLIFIGAAAALWIPRLF